METYRNLRIPAGLDRLKGREAVEQVRQLLPVVETEGEIRFLRHIAKDQRLVFPVSRAGIEAMVEVDLRAQTATGQKTFNDFLGIPRVPLQDAWSTQPTGQGHLIGVRVWRWFTDVTIYLLLFISISGPYLWWAIRAERTIGLRLLTAGSLTFFGLIYAIAG